MNDLEQKKAFLKQLIKAKIDQEDRDVKYEETIGGKKNSRMVFIYCSPRSGSTVLRLMLAGHSRLFSPPEFHLLRYDTLNEWAEDIAFNYKYGGLIRSIRELMGYSQDEANGLVADLIAKNTSVREAYRMLQDRLGRRMLVDKSPSYTASLEILQKAEALFDSPLYIYLIRHPYSVIDSIVRNRIYTYTMTESEDPFKFAEKTWFIRNQNCKRFFSEIAPARFLTVKYETLVSSAHSILADICKFLGLSFEEPMLHPYEGNRMVDGAGDPNIFNHDKVVRSLGDTWKTIKLPIELSDETRALATNLGYELP